MTSEIAESHAESVRVMLWALMRLLEREDASARSALFEMRTLAGTALQHADAWLDSRCECAPH